MALYIFITLTRWKLRRMIMREQLAIKPEFDVLLNFDNLILIVSSDWCILILENRNFVRESCRS